MYVVYVLWVFEIVLSWCQFDDVKRCRPGLERMVVQASVLGLPNLQWLGVECSPSWINIDWQGHSGFIFKKWILQHLREAHHPKVKAYQIRTNSINSFYIDMFDACAVELINDGTVEPVTRGRGKLEAAVGSHWLPYLVTRASYQLSLCWHTSTNIVTSYNNFISTIWISFSLIRYVFFLIISSIQ